MSDKYLHATGNFVCTVKAPGNGWFGESGQKQTPYIRIPLIVHEGDEEGKEIVWQGWLTEKAVDRTVETLAKVFGWDGDMEALADGKTSFEGLLCEIVTEMEEVNGEPRCKVKWLNRLGGGAPAMDPAKAKSIIAALGRRSKALAKETLKAEGITPGDAPKAEGKAGEPF